MRTAEQIAETIRQKAAETVKNEVIALSEEEFESFIIGGGCPSDFRLVENCKVVGDDALEICTECWKKATGRK